VENRLWVECPETYPMSHTSKLRQNSSDSCIVYKLHCLGLSQTQLTKPFLDVLHNCKTINKSGVPLSELPMRVEHLQHIHHVRPRSHGAPIAAPRNHFRRHPRKGAATAGDHRPPAVAQNLLAEVHGKDMATMRCGNYRIR